MTRLAIIIIALAACARPPEGQGIRPADVIAPVSRRPPEAVPGPVDWSRRCYDCGAYDGACAEDCPALIESREDTTTCERREP